ncbi:MFS transporter [Acidithiobacillus sp.]|jgi:MFS family permease|uniref:MFS transporter n=1 Tax=Acidithiobacillus sp. TaxID=1872118 RepID=UPI0025C6FBDC|nr:MFS transporter [Acidithiobacillus sp.]MCK9189194.1 MFS transporter [Acidithiobacillus sp.]MCK9359636.1 MFS transporter [Acidithiobacillus sp.]
MDKMWNRLTIGLLIGSALSSFSVWIDFLVILTLTSYIYHANAFLMALISALILGPSVFLAPRVGRLVDTLNNHFLVLILSLVLRSSITMLLLFKPLFPFFCLIVFFRSVIALPENPASNVISARIIPHGDISHYFSLLGLLRSASKIGAPTLGVLIASSYGESLAIEISIGMTLAAAIVIFYSFYKFKPNETYKDKTHKKENTCPIKTEKASDLLLKQLLLTVTTYSFMVFFINNQLPVLLRSSGYNMILLGVLVTSSGAGGILAASYLSRRSCSKSLGTMNPMQATIVSVIIIALCFVALGCAFMLPLSIASYAATMLFFCTGIFSATESIRANVVVVQEFSRNAGEITAKLGSFRNSAMLVAPWIAAIFMYYKASMPILFIIDGGVGLVVLVGITGLSMYSRPIKRKES